MGEDFAANALELFQPTQLLSQDEERQFTPLQSVWGSFIPHNRSMARIDFNEPVAEIGRFSGGLDDPIDLGLQNIIVTGRKISNLHLRVYHQGRDIVIVTDLSSNGTYVDGERIGLGKHRLLKHGSQIALGSTAFQPDGQDHRYYFELSPQYRRPTQLQGRYDIAHELGRGGFSVVTKGLSWDDGQLYAIKTVDYSPAVMREISILEQMNHINICQMKEYIYEEDGNTISLILELAPGGDLFDYIESYGPLTESRARSIAFQICRAVQHFHSQGIIHRDLKPENVLLSTQEPDVHPIVKVADFGSARGNSDGTLLQTICGTRAYLAPEVIEGRETGYQKVADSWSIGVIIFLMLTDHQISFRDDIKTRLFELDDVGVSKTGKDFIRQLLEREPEERMSMSDAMEHAWFVMADEEQ